MNSGFKEDYSSFIVKNLENVKKRIAEVCKRAGRNPDSVKLVAVSKTMPPAMIESAWNAGQRIFGENYVQELEEKDKALENTQGLEWHFIGHLQRNKVKKLPPRVSMIQSVDSVRLLQEIEKRAGEAGRSFDILIQVNVGEEESKSGSMAEEVDAILNSALSMKFVKVRGLMAIPPFEEESENSRKWFVMLREIRDKLGGEKLLPELSMGMSNDFEIAIEEGATIVRVGTAIFGERKTFK